MKGKKTMSDEDARRLIADIRRRASGLPGSTRFDYFHDWPAVSELVEGTLIGVGFDADWVNGPFSRMLEKEVERHRVVVYGEGTRP